MIPQNQDHPLWVQTQHQILWAPLRMLEGDHAALLLKIQELQTIFRKWSRQSPTAWILVDKIRVRTWLRNHRLHLAAHFKAEESIIFPYLAKHQTRLRGVLGKLAKEHLAIRRQSLSVEADFVALTNRRNLPQTGKRFCEKSIRLLRLIERHVTQEQRLIEKGL